MYIRSIAEKSPVLPQFFRFDLTLSIDILKKLDIYMLQVVVYADMSIT